MQSPTGVYPVVYDAFPLRTFVCSSIAHLPTRKAGSFPSFVCLRGIIQHGIAFAHRHNAASSSNSPEWDCQILTPVLNITRRFYHDSFLHTSSYLRLSLQWASVHR